MYALSHKSHTLIEIRVVLIYCSGHASADNSYLPKFPVISSAIDRGLATSHFAVGDYSEARLSKAIKKTSTTNNKR